MGTIGVILAGGLSSRMGQDKALMRLGNTTMLEQTYHELSRTSVNRIVISRNEKNSDCLPDLIPGKGPLSGIHSAAIRFPLDNLLFVPVDLPLINFSTLNELIKYGTQFDCNMRYKKHPLPLYINNNESVRQHLTDTLTNDSHYSVNRFCHSFSLKELELKNKQFLFNTNTPEQWKFATQQHSINRIAYNQEESYESLPSLF